MKAAPRNTWPVGRECMVSVMTAGRPVPSVGQVQAFFVSHGLRGATAAERTELCTQWAPALAAVPGIVSLTWLSNEATGRYGGFTSSRTSPPSTPSSPESCTRRFAHNGRPKRGRHNELGRSPLLRDPGRLSSKHPLGPGVPRRLRRPVAAAQKSRGLKKEET
jgi:hypothetical protein